MLTVNPNDIDDREAMGLPASFVERADEEALRAALQSLASRDPSRLVGLVEDPSASFVERYAAGTVLGLFGDPRIVVDDPQMLDVPARTFRVGLRPEKVDDVVAAWRHVGVLEEWIRKETPEHEVHLEPFRIARYPVTNSEFRTFLLDTDAHWLPTSWQFGVYPSHRSNHPVWTVPPEAADSYAHWLSARTGRRFRLPTEFEWELAASGGDGREYPWGDEFRPDHANTVEAGPLRSTPVGIYPEGRSPIGCDDIAGNVEEYVDADYQPYPGGTAVEDDLMKLGPTYRIARGGSFTRYGDLARCTRRHGWYGKRIYAMGYRLAESI